MGEEIQKSRFSKKDYKNYAARLQQELELLKRWFEQKNFSDEYAIGGFEQEAWLIGQDALPSSHNEVFLQRMNHELLSPELAQFNVELNVNPQPLNGNGLRQMHNDLDALWKLCLQTAAQDKDDMVMVGILPTVADRDLTLQNMSAMNRYRALNEQVMHARKGSPLVLDIPGVEHLRSEHFDVMLESVATSFQIHRQIPVDSAVRYYNAAIIASAPTVALGANSPFLFGTDLWDETRIPVFEQAVAVGGYGEAAMGPIRRVSFGSGYVRNSLFECFTENVEHFPILLPVELEDPVERLPYLRLHNGTIWRWNRPLIGFDDQGVAHVRIEHRVIAAGPTVMDEIANAAFFYGLQEYLANQEQAPEKEMEFSKAKSNFYNAAQSGLRARIDWFDDNKHVIDALIKTVLLPQARQGLEMLDMARDDINDYLGVIEARVATMQNGADWQRAFVKKNGRDMVWLTKAYLENQKRGNPVHQWSVD